MSTKRTPSEKEGTLAIAVSTPTNDILTKLEQEIKNLKHIEETPYKSNLTIEGFATKIDEETQIANLIRMGSVALAKKRAYDEYADTLGLGSYPVFTIAGGGLDAVTHDIKLRIAILQHKERLETLKGFKTEMSKFLTEAEQKADLIKRMEGFFSNLG